MSEAVAAGRTLTLPSKQSKISSASPSFFREDGVSVKTGQLHPEAPGLPHTATNSALVASSYTPRPSLLRPTKSRRAKSSIPSDITFPRSPTRERSLSDDSAKFKNVVH